MLPCVALSCHWYIRFTNGSLARVHVPPGHVAATVSVKGHRARSFLHSLSCAQKHVCAHQEVPPLTVGRSYAHLPTYVQCTRQGIANAKDPPDGTMTCGLKSGRDNTHRRRTHDDDTQRTTSNKENTVSTMQSGNHPQTTCVTC